MNQIQKKSSLFVRRTMDRWSEKFLGVQSLEGQRQDASGCHGWGTGPYHLFHTLFSPLCSHPQPSPLHNPFHFLVCNLITPLLLSHVHTCFPSHKISPALSRGSQIIPTGKSSLVASMGNRPHSLQDNSGQATATATRKLKQKSDASLPNSASGSCVQTAE